VIVYFAKTIKHLGESNKGVKLITSEAKKFKCINRFKPNPPTQHEGAKIIVVAK
jgi:hypothetical protein